MAKTQKRRNRRDARRYRSAVRISRHEYERLRNAADLLDAVASLIRELLPSGD